MLNTKEKLNYVGLICLVYRSEKDMIEIKRLTTQVPSLSGRIDQKIILTKIIFTIEKLEIQKRKCLTMEIVYNQKCSAKERISHQ